MSFDYEQIYFAYRTGTAIVERFNNMTFIISNYSIANKKLGIKTDDLLEKSGLQKIEQQYKKVSN